MDRLDWSKICIRAFEIAFRIHKDQVDKSGMTYWWHPLRVANSMKGWRLQTIGILHDVLEDGGETTDSLREQGITDETVLTALTALTKTPGESYREYLCRVRDNHDARLVKLADINDNMSVERLSYISEGQALKMAEKYRKALRFLRNIEDEV